MHRIRRPFTYSAGMLGLLVFLLLSSVFAGTVMAEQADSSGKVPGRGNTVVVIPVHQTIETGLQKFIERAFYEAEQMDPAYIILDINTLGGRLDATLDIGDVINSSPVPTVAFIRDKAISAGSYIALSADQIAMQPGSSIGAAAMIRSTGEYVNDPKQVSAWVSMMVGAAEKNGRNTDIAAGMVDLNRIVQMPEIGKTKQSGEVITLTVGEALKVGYAEWESASIDALKAQLGVEQLQTVTIEPTLAEKVARYLTDPMIMPLLLIAGIAGVAIELFVPGFGIPGIIGILGFGLYFFGSYIAGFAGVEHIAMFIVGFLLLVIEMFVPSFGIIGALGSISLVAGVILAAYDTGNAAKSLGIAFAVSLVIVTIVAVYFRKRGVWNRFILKDELKTEAGYVSAESKEHLLHKTGKTITPLRPSGTVIIDGERIDVVTEGGWIPRDYEVVVTFVEGSRVVVKQINGKN